MRKSMIIKCPDCGCKPEEGFDVVEEHTEIGDNRISTKYRCPRCNKTHTRIYKFVGWGSSE